MKTSRHQYGTLVTFFHIYRSVQDELERESTSDALTVAMSYLAMLAYIAIALGSLPALDQPWEVFVSRCVGGR
jgi:hypothetical protein